MVRIQQENSFWKADGSGLPRYHITYLIGVWGLNLCALLLLAGCKPGLVNKPPTQSQVTNTREGLTTQSPLLLTTATHSLPTIEPEQPIEFEPQLYTHPQGLFSLGISENWSLTQDQSSVIFSDTLGKLNVQVQIINTGYILDAVSFENFLETQKKIRASDLEDYIEVSRQQISGPTAVLLTNQFSDQGVMKTSSIFYQQQDQALLILDFLVEQHLFESYRGILNELISSVMIDPDAVSKIPIYSFDQAKKYSNGYFSIRIPSYWRINHVSGENSIVDTIVSPDEQAIIQTIVYDDGQHMSRNIAGDLVLTLLRENYTKSITVLADEMLSDGREKLSWQSKNADYSGITTFETGSSKLFMITVMWGNDPEQYYQNILKDIIDSYTMEQPGEGRSIQMISQ